ncbi:hypothetical protein M9458_018471, partial [Cirrhinus mrigala]
MQFLILTFLLGGTSTYWRSMVRDPVLWKYFLRPFISSAVLDDSEMQFDYMA